MDAPLYGRRLSILESNNWEPFQAVESLSVAASIGEVSQLFGLGSLKNGP